MKNFLKEMDNLPKLLKIILCLPGLDIIWAVYRIIKGVTKDSLVQLIVGILWILPGAPFLWLVDMITTILQEKILFADL